MRRSRPLVLILAVAALAGGGCYTVLRHPMADDLTDVHGTQRACADCHIDADLHHYTQAYGASWYSYYPAPWAMYYGSPWWYEDYWYYVPDTDQPALPAPRGGRNVWSRDGGGPGFVPYQGAPNIAPAPSGKEETPRATGEDEKREKKEKKKRTLWGR